MVNHLCNGKCYSERFMLADCANVVNGRYYGHKTYRQSVEDGMPLWKMYFRTQFYYVCYDSKSGRLSAA